MRRGRVTVFELCFVVFAAACGSPAKDGEPGAGGNGAAGTGVANSGAGGTAGTTGVAGSGSGVAGTTGVAGSNSGVAGTTGVAGGGPAGAPGKGGSSGVAGGGVAGSVGGGHAGTTGVGGSAGGVGSPGGTGGSATPSSVLVTSASGAYWKTGTWTETTSGSATVTVNDGSPAQKWEGFGGAFNELGWSYLTTSALQTQAMTLLFSATDGAAFAWGRIPIGASDYAMSRYTLDDMGTDPMPSGESNRPGPATFSLTRDGQKLIPYIKAAQAVNPGLRFWASPWTPPVYMKTGYKTDAGYPATGNAKRPSFYDGGNMKTDGTTLMAYATYFTNFVKGYKDMGITIEVVSPQNEPGYDQNYPSCLWDGTTYTTFIAQYLGPAMKDLGVKVMLGTLSNDKTDFGVASTALANSMAKSFFSVIGAQWNTLDATKLKALNSGLSVWATEHKCGNYPFADTSTKGCGDANDACPAYNSSQAPNDQAYGVESWKYIRNAIKTIGVTAYNAWNMVLDKKGLGIDTTRDWKQDALLVADSGTLTPTPAYYVFRHLSQYVVPGATVVGTTGGDALAFKNPDGSLVAVMFNSGSANSSYVVAIGGKKLQFAMPANGWATVKYKP